MGDADAVRGVPDSVRPRSKEFGAGNGKAGTTQPRDSVRCCNYCGYSPATESSLRRAAPTTKHSQNVSIEVLWAIPLQVDAKFRSYLVLFGTMLLVEPKCLLLGIAE